MTTADKDLPQYDNASQALNDHGIMVLMDEINHETVKPVIEWILHENHVRKKKHKVKQTCPIKQRPRPGSRWKD